MFVAPTIRDKKHIYFVVRGKKVTLEKCRNPSHFKTSRFLNRIIKLTQAFYINRRSVVKTITEKISRPYIKKCSLYLYGDTKSSYRYKIKVFVVL